MTHQCGWGSISHPTGISGTPVVAALSGAAAAGFGAAETDTVLAAAAPPTILAGFQSLWLTWGLKSLHSPPHVVGCHSAFIFPGAN